MGFNWWNKQAGNLILGSRSYLAGKQGFLPDWQIKGKGLKEIYAPEQYLKAGKMIRSGVLDRAGAFGTGLLGIGKPTTGGKGNGGSWSDQYNPFKWVDDQKKDFVNEYERRMDDLYNVIPENPIPSGTDASQIIKDAIPTVDLSGVGKGVKGGMDDFALALAMGLGSLGQGIGGGIGGLSGAVPSMPSMTLTDEEGAPNLLVIGGLGVIAYMVLRGGK